MGKSKVLISLRNGHAILVDMTSEEYDLFTSYFIGQVPSFSIPGLGIRISEVIAYSLFTRGSEVRVQKDGRNPFFDIMRN